MENRVEKLKKICSQNKQAMYITSLENIYYVSGLDFTDGAVLVLPNKAYLLVDFRYGEVAQKTVKHLDVVVFDNLLQTVKKLCLESNAKEILVESQTISFGYAQRIIKLFSDEKIDVVTNSFLSKKLSNMRLIKSSQELELIKKAQEIAEYAYMENLNFIKVGVTQREIALNIEFLMRKQGAEKVAFDLITISGSTTSLPHGVPDNTPIKEGDFITMDIGAVYKGYHSDMTRTIALKYASDKQIEVYNTVLKAQTEALKSVKSGVMCSACDKVARDIIANAGYGDFYKHATGHGVGLEIHEEPRVSPNSDVILSQGMVITIEPGIYIPNEFGVRIEDMVNVTEKGYQNFATITKELTII